MIKQECLLSPDRLPQEFTALSLSTRTFPQSLVLIGQILRKLSLNKGQTNGRQTHGRFAKNRFSQRFADGLHNDSSYLKPDLFPMT